MSKNLLFIDYLIPTPDKDAGSLLAFNTILLLKNSGFNVIVTSFSPHNKLKYKKLLSKNNIFFLEPKYLDDYLNKKGKEIDFIYGTRYNAYGYLLNLLKLKCINAKFIFHTVDLAFLRETRELNLIKSQLNKKLIIQRKKEISLLKKHELNCIKQSDVSILTSTVEEKYLRKIDKKSKLTTLGLIDKPKFTKKKFEQRKNIIFLGNYHHTPNMDAVKYFIKRIMPKLIKLGFKDKFLIAGSFREEELKKLARKSKQVKYIGYKKNLYNLFNNTKLFVSPLRFGAGVKGKLVTSVSYGLPIIASKITLEGMGLGNKIVSYSNEKQLLEKIINFYYSEKQWKKYKENIETIMIDHFGQKTFNKNLEKCFKKIGYNFKFQTNHKIY